MNADRDYTLITKGIRIPKFLVDYLEDIADKNLLKISDVVRQIIMRDYEANKSLNDKKEL